MDHLHRARRVEEPLLLRAEELAGEEDEAGADPLARGEERLARGGRERVPLVLEESRGGSPAEQLREPRVDRAPDAGEGLRERGGHGHALRCPSGRDGPEGRGV